MAERIGYIYRRADVGHDDLRSMVGADSTGWSWTPAFMYTRGARRDDDLLRGDEGCARRGDSEIRWRRISERDAAARYEVLVLALAEQALDGFAPLLAGDAPWRVAPTSVRLQHPLGDQTDATGDEPHAATCFLAPDGSVQFVALIGDDER